MNRLNRTILSFGAVALGLGATSCFTGVESTPKITAHDVKREKIIERPEDTYLSGIDRQPFAEWTPGKRFYVTDNKISLMLGATGAAAGDLAGDTIVLKEIIPAQSVTGEDVTDIVFSTPSGHSITYRAGASPQRLRETGSVDIPFVIEESLIKQVASRMKGNTYFVTTSAWYDTEGNARTGRRFVPVTVDDVTFGNSFYPVRLLMKDENGNPFSLYLSTGKDLKAPRKFANIFTLTDPRLRYPMISDENWKLIINGRVALDMTRDEARLALGAPANIDRRPGYSFMREIWTYENGIFLIFEDGLLKNFRQ